MGQVSKAWHSIAGYLALDRGSRASLEETRFQDSRQAEREAGKEGQRYCSWGGRQKSLSRLGRWS